MNKTTKIAAAGFGPDLGLFDWAAETAETGLRQARKRAEATNKVLENVSSQLAKPS